MERADQPLVSIIIPCYNHGKYLHEAVDSVLASTYQNIEIIIINDGSYKDMDFLKTFSAPKTRIIHQENQGVSMARNNGIKEAKGQYILPLDADDKIHLEYIEKAVKVLEDNPKKGIVYCEAEFFGIKTGKWELEKYKFPNILYKNIIFCSALFRKSDWEKVGGYKKEMIFAFEDWEFWITLIENGVEVYQIPETLFYYRQNSCSRSRDSENEKMAIFKKIIKLHYNLYADNLIKIFIPLFMTLIHYRLKKYWYNLIIKKGK